MPRNLCALPKVITHYKVDGRHVYVAPEKASHIDTNEMGHTIINLLRKGRGIDGIFDELGKQSLKKEEIAAELKEVLTQVDKHGFYENAVVTDAQEDKIGLQIYVTNRCNLR